MSVIKHENMLKLKCSINLSISSKSCNTELIAINLCWEIMIQILPQHTFACRLFYHFLRYMYVVALSVMVIVMRNEIGNQSSNPGQGCLCFTVLIMPLGKNMNPSVLFPAMSK